MSSAIRRNYSEDCEASINKQINMELYASYVYMSMSYYYDRDDVALPGLAKFFKKNSDEEREHAEKLMKYQNSRGGRIVLQAVAAPTLQEWGNAFDGLQAALDLEKQVNQSLLDLHALGGTANDPHMTKFLEDEYLDEQVEAIKELGDMITKLKRAGPTGVGEYLFDKDLQS
uniref:Ferritin n=1 Tax=Palaemon carinicauda TaxID=392227 RepID=A0A218KFK2_PALCI|nr:ferritin [Palaemon carinicauda]